MRATLKSTKNIRENVQDVNNNNFIRVWDRLARLKNVALSPIKVGSETEISQFQRNILCSRLSMLHNVEILTGCCYPMQDWILKAMLSVKDSYKRILKFDISIANDFWSIHSGNPITTYPLLKPLELLNCKDITMNNLYFYIKWSKECKVLKLKKNLGKVEWMKFVIDNCDCSGIEYFYAHGLKLCLSNESNSNSIVTEPINVVRNFAKLFCNLKKLEIIFRGSVKFNTTYFLFRFVEKGV